MGRLLKAMPLAFGDEMLKGRGLGFHLEKDENKLFAPFFKAGQIHLAASPLAQEFRGNENGKFLPVEFPREALFEKVSFEGGRFGYHRMLRRVFRRENANAAKTSTVKGRRSPFF